MSIKKIERQGGNSGFRYVLNAALVSILGLFGISCEKIGDIINGGLVCMYGCPSSIFQVKGTIVDENDKPVKGIQVVGWHYAADTLHTDAEGIVLDEFQSSSRGLTYYIEDVDGEANGGKFAKDTVTDDEIHLKLIKSDSSNNPFGEKTFEATFKKSLKRE